MKKLTFPPNLGKVLLLGLLVLVLSGLEGDGIQAVHAQETTPAWVTESLIQPPDILWIEASGLTKKYSQTVQGEHLVRPDGTVSLGVYGSVLVAGMFPEQAQVAISKHLASFVKKGKPDVRIEVLSFNSKVCYVITDSEAGEQVLRCPLIRGETVASVIQAEQLETAAAKGPVQLVRQAGTRSRVFDVDWRAVMRDEQSATNYKLEAGDRLYVGCSPQKPSSGAPDVSEVNQHVPSDKTDPEKLHEKLDQILNQLERLNDRMTRVEQKLADRATASQPVQATPCGIAAFISSLLGFPTLHDRYSSNPTGGMKDLSDRPEELQRLQEEWDRLWFKDNPNHKPERKTGDY